MDFSGDSLGGFDFLRRACSPGIPVPDPLNLIRSGSFTNTPYISTRLYKPPSLHTGRFKGRRSLSEAKHGLDMTWENLKECLFCMLGQHSTHT